MSHDRDVKYCECGKSLWDGAVCNCKEEIMSRPLERKCTCGQEVFVIGKIWCQLCEPKEEPMKAKQIGGNHYEADYQHWDWMNWGIWLTEMGQDPATARRVFQSNSYASVIAAARCLSALTCAISVGAATTMARCDNPSRTRLASIKEKAGSVA